MDPPRQQGGGILLMEDGILFIYLLTSLTSFSFPPPIIAYDS